MADKETIAAELKKHIRGKGITQKEAAEKVGLSSPHFSNLLNAQEPIGYAAARRICDAFPEISITFLMTGEGSLLGGAPVQHLENVKISGSNNGNVSITSGAAALKAENERLKAENEWLRGMVEALTKK